MTNRENKDKNVHRNEVRGENVKLLMEKKDQICIFRLAANLFCRKTSFDLYKDDISLLGIRRRALGSESSKILGIEILCI